MRWSRGLQTDVLVDLERPVEPCLTPPRALSDVLTCRVVVFCAEFPQSEAYIACVKYVHKYISKPDRFVTSRLHCAAKWHEQARMLSHALPVDVVRVIGAHVCERAAIMLQKWMRGAAVRLAWGLPCLCDMDGNLVYLL
jgi:hypothetical protein